MKNNKLISILTMGVLVTTLTGCSQNNQEFTKEDVAFIEYLVKNTTVLDVIKSQVNY